MRYGLGLSVLAGMIIGGILGTLYFMWSAKLLICGPIPVTVIWLPDDVQGFIWQQAFRWGTVPGIVIGLLGGLNTDATMPRGRMSMGIGALCWLVCTILAWVTQWHFLADTLAWKIAATIAFTFIGFLFNLRISQMFSFIEAIRE